MLRDREHGIPTIPPDRQRQDRRVRVPILLAFILIAVVVTAPVHLARAQAEATAESTLPTDPPTPSPTATAIATATATIETTVPPSPTPRATIVAEPTMTPASDAPAGLTEEPGLATCAEAGERPVSASLAGELPPLLYSSQERIVSGAVWIEILNPEQCTGWALDVSATDLIYRGQAPGSYDLPASNLAVVLPDGSVVPLAPEPRRVVTNGGEAPSYVYGLQLLIPGSAPVGDYTTTITISTSTAPGE